MVLRETVHRRRFVAGLVCGAVLSAAVFWAISWSHRPSVTSRLMPNVSRAVVVSPGAHGLPPGYQVVPVPPDGGVPGVPYVSPPSLPDGWHRKEFNGSEYYVVPLASR
jgi:hypothetical protein